MKTPDGLRKENAKYLAHRGEITFADGFDAYRDAKARAGRAGGAKTTPAKRAAVAVNGAFGGRPADGTDPSWRGRSVPSARGRNIVFRHAGGDDLIARAASVEAAVDIVRRVRAEPAPETDKGVRARIRNECGL